MQGVVPALRRRVAVAEGRVEVVVQGTHILCPRWCHLHLPVGADLLFYGQWSDSVVPLQCRHLILWPEHEHVLRSFEAPFSTSDNMYWWSSIIGASHALANSNFFPTSAARRADPSGFDEPNVGESATRIGIYRQAHLGSIAHRTNDSKIQVCADAVKALTLARTTRAHPPT